MSRKCAVGCTCGRHNAAMIEARWQMRNRKSARFANPFFILGEIRDTEDGGLTLHWEGERPKWGSCAGQ